MKKLICLLLAVLMALSLMACGAEDAPQNESTDASAPGQSESETDSQPGSEDPSENPTDESSETVTEESTDSAPSEATEATEETTEAPTQDVTEPPVNMEVDYSQEILGSWTGSIAMETTDMGLNQETMAGFESRLEIPLTMVFHADGSADMVIDEEKLLASVTAFEADLVAFMVDYMYAELEAAGYDRATADDLFWQAYQMSVEQFCQETVAQMNLSDAFRAVATTGTGTYTLEGNQLTLDGEVMIISLEGDTLSLLSSDMPEKWNAIGAKFPIVLTREK